MKLAYLYGIDSVNPYLSTYSHYPLTRKISFVDKIFDDKPLLIVGINTAKKLYPNQINLDKNHIKDNIYWCYSPEEYLSEFLKKYEEFILNIHNNYLKILNFEIVDLFFKNINKQNQLIDFLENSNIDIYYHLNKMLYCYSIKNNKIYIINLYEFIWFEKIKIKELRDFFKEKIYYDDCDYKIYNYFINLFQEQDSFFIEKTIPYFIYIKNKIKYINIH
jgi:hypothetical protein